MDIKGLKWELGCEGEYGAARCGVGPIAVLLARELLLRGIAHPAHSFAPPPVWPW